MRIKCDIMVLRNDRNRAAVRAISRMAKRHLLKPGGSYVPVFPDSAREFAAEGDRRKTT